MAVDGLAEELFTVGSEIGCERKADRATAVDGTLFDEDCVLTTTVGV